MQDAQNGCPARPQRVKRRGVRFGTLSLCAMRERRWLTFSASCYESGLRVLILLVPGHLDRFEDFFVRCFWIVPEVGERHDPGVHIGESNRERVCFRMFFD